MHVVIPSHLVADGDVDEPTAGAVLRFGVRVVDFRGAIEEPRRLLRLEGRVTWARFDHFGIGAELVVATDDGFPVLTQGTSNDEETMPRPGDLVVVEGRAIAIAGNEYVDSALPDVRTEWIVGSWSQREETLDYYVHVRPVV